MRRPPSLAAAKAAHVDLWFETGKWPRVEDMARVLGCSWRTARALMAAAQLQTSLGKPPTAPRRPRKAPPPPDAAERKPVLTHEVASRLSEAASVLRVVGGGLEPVALYLEKLKAWNEPRPRISTHWVEREPGEK